MADAPDDLTGPGPGSPADTWSGRLPLLATAAGLACLGLAVLLWPGADLDRRTEQARQTERADRELVRTLEGQRDEARAAAEASASAAETARSETAATRARQAVLLEAEAAVEEAEAALLERLQAVIASADAVVGAQNDAVTRSNRGDEAGEREILLSRAVPAVEQLRVDVAAVPASLEPLRSAVADLQGQLP